MTWIGIADRHEGWFDATRSGRDRSVQPDPYEVLRRGTLMIETRISPENRPQTLLAFERSHPMPGRFSLEALPGGSVVLVEAQGNDVRTAVLPCPYEDRTDIVRLTYSWDADVGLGQLTIERARHNSTHTVHLEDARPMVLNDLYETMMRPAHRQMDSGVIFVALSDDVEPVGPMPGLTAHTRIMTHLGDRPVHELKRGDVVLTHRGEAVPVLQVIRRTVPAKGGFKPVKLRAGYFGLTRDIFVAPYQQLVMQGTDVEYNFGSEAVLVPAQHLVNNISAMWANGPKMVVYYQLLLPGHEAVMTAGCALESLYIGRIRRKPEVLATSILAPYDRSRLPEHAKPVWPVLPPFDAITLASNRAT